METVNWIIDEYLLERENGDHMADVLEKLGYPVIKTKYVPFSDDNKLSTGTHVDGPTVLYGTHGLIRQLRSRWNPGAYCNEDNLRVSKWSLKYPQGWLLNRIDQIEYMPFAQVKLLKEYETGEFFLRPDSVTKTFAGHIIYDESDIATIEQTTSANDDTWCVVCHYLKEIIAEYRYVIVEGKVITGSQYKRADVLDIRIDTMAGADELAKNVAEYHWQPDTVYVCDIAETYQGFKIVEINSFSCAGLYACDKILIAKAVSQAAINEFCGD